MEVSYDADFIYSIEKNLDGLPREAKESFEKIKLVFSSKKINIVGGFVRDSILRSLYDYSFPINDLDILIEDNNFRNKSKYFSEVKVNRFGGLKFKSNGFSIDVFSLEEVYLFKNNPNLEKSLDNFLIHCDLKTSSLAYNLYDKEILSFGALESFFRKEVDVLNEDTDFAPTISRLILHSDKMNFNIGKKGLDYVKENYSEGLDSEIKDWLNYKEIPHLFPLIKRKINSILK